MEHALPVTISLLRVPETAAQTEDKVAFKTVQTSVQLSSNRKMAEDVRLSAPFIRQANHSFSQPAS